ncbi:Uncharacterised protein [Bordetella pertussis]|nr:Uncharacterised protein [Bordetella pertussis]
MLCDTNPSGISASSWARNSAETDWPPRMAVRSAQSVLGLMPWARAACARLISHSGDIEATS